MQPREQIDDILDTIEQDDSQLSEELQLIRHVLDEDIELSLRVDRCKQLLDEIPIPDLTRQMQVFSLRDLLGQLSDTERERAQPGQ